MRKKLKVNIGIFSLILVIVCAALVTLDLITKHFEEAFGWDFDIIKGWIEIDGGARNQGCAFSFLNDNPEIGQPVLIALTSVMLVALIGVFVFLPERFVLLKICLSMIIAGAFGNLIDRLAFREVRDFIGLNMLFNGNMVSCNLADFYITIGAFLAVIDMLFLNEWAVIPLTKKAKAAQKKREEEQKTGGDAK